MTTGSRDWRVLLSLALPILVLGGLAASKHWIRHQGSEARLSIEGFDPRDLLAGHYLTYRILYDIPVCPASPATRANKERPAHVCLQPRAFGWGPQPRSPCELFIQGVCQQNQFVAGLERFYIPEQHAHALDRAVRDKKGEIIISVTHAGTAQVKELLIEGRPWKEVVLP